MKVTVAYYLIFLNFYVIDSARLSSEVSQNKTATTSVINSLKISRKPTTTTAQRNSSNRNFATKPVTTVVYNEPIKKKDQNKTQQQKQQQQRQQNFRTRPTAITQSNTGNLRYSTAATTESNRITTTTTVTADAHHQYVELPTYRQQRQQPVFSSTLQTKRYKDTDDAAIPDLNKSDSFSTSVSENANEINDGRSDQVHANAVADMGSRNKDFKYGMKTTTKTKIVRENIVPSTGKNNEQESGETHEKKQQQTLKLKGVKPEIPIKYISSTDEKNHVPKKYISATSTKTKTTNSKESLGETNNGPTKISLQHTLAKSSVSLDTLVCPKETEAHFNLFAVNCKTDSDCTEWNKEFRCCSLFGSKNCHRGVSKPLQEPKHSPILGIIPRKCPERPLAELFWNLKTCETDDDCWPRVCCPDGKNRYCRTSTPEYESVPFQIGRPLAYEYLECTAPPPPIFDLHPKACNSTLDCFPNVCCQEAGKKNCRPPKKSVLSFMANFLNVGLVRRLTNSFVIRR